MSDLRRARILDAARTLRGSDPEFWTWSELAWHFNVKVHWLRRHIDDAYAAKFKTEHVSRDGERGKRPMTRDQLRRHHATQRRDMRSLTGRLMGDPQPDRSALAMKQRCVSQ